MNLVILKNVPLGEVLVKIVPLSSSSSFPPEYTPQTVHPLRMELRNERFDMKAV